MPLEPPEEGHTWLTVPLDHPLDVTVVGDPATWHTHWHRGHGSKQSQAVRCLRLEEGRCEWCAAGYERRVRYVLPVRVDGEQRLLELGRVQYPALYTIQSMHGLVGAQIRLSRERPHRNAPIQVRHLHTSTLPPDDRVDIAPFAQTLGRQQLRFLDPGPSLNGQPPRR